MRIEEVSKYWSSFEYSAACESGRFWSKVGVSEDLDACWLWRASVRKDGYGAASFRGKTVGSQRVAWELMNGPAGSKHVLHSCDSRYKKGDISYRRCCNPNHLFLGTHEENMADMASKGRGNRNPLTKPNASLTPQIVAMIRTEYESGEKGLTLATKYGVSDGTIAHIVSGRTWGEAGGPVRGFKPRGEMLRGSRNGTAKLDEDTVKLIRAEHALGDSTQLHLSRKFAVSPMTISLIVRRKIWTHI